MPGPPGPLAGSEIGEAGIPSAAELAVGTRPMGQASSMAPMSITTSLPLASGDFGSDVSATTFTR